jgi:hypothetical protein
MSLVQSDTVGEFGAISQLVLTAHDSSTLCSQNRSNDLLNPVEIH